MDIPNILKQRKQLAKLVLDYDSARARFVQTSLSPVCQTICRGHTGRKKKQPEVKVLKTFAIMMMFFFFNFDLSKLRWLQATKSIISGTNTQALTAKADLLKEEMDESMNKVEQCKVMDDLAPVFQQMLLLRHQPL